AMLSIGRRIHDAIEMTLRLRVENRGLIDSLRKSNEVLETRVAERTAALQEVDRRKDDFLAMLSHELRNPLAPIRHSLHILDRVEPGSEEARRAIDVIQRQARQVTRLVDDLLDLTRISHGKIELRREAVDLGQLVARSVEDHQSMFTELDISLASDLPQ